MGHHCPRPHHREPPDRHIRQDDRARPDGRAIPDMDLPTRPIFSCLEISLCCDRARNTVIREACPWSDKHSIINRHTAVQQGVILNLDVATDDHAKINIDALPHIAIRSYMYALSYLSLVPDACTRVDNRLGGNLRGWMNLHIIQNLTHVLFHQILCNDPIPKLISQAASRGFLYAFVSATKT